MNDLDAILRQFDAAFLTPGARVICGVDEVGRGPLAGPVVAAAVILPGSARLPGLDDSKRIAPARRVALAAAIRACASAVGIAFVGPRRIEAVNIRQASLLAMRRAVFRAVDVARGRARRRPGSGALRPDELLVLVDGIDSIPGMSWPQRAIVGGDGRSRAIAAASVVAKVARDEFMTRLATEYPGYGFERNYGYGTPEHLAALQRAGACSWHRRTFAPIARPDLFSTSGAG